MDGAIIFLVVLLLLAMIGGGVYFFWYRQYSCNNKGADTSSNVVSWKWSSDDSACYADKCSKGYSTDGTSTTCSADDNKFTELYIGKDSSTGSNVCTGTIITADASLKSDSMCSSNCVSDSTCYGYAWDSKTCTRYSSDIAAPTGTAVKGTHCYKKSS
jgi:hypothetical protein